MSAISIEFLQERLGGRTLGPAYDEGVPHDRVLAQIDIGPAGGTVATQVIIDPKSSDGIRIYHRNERILPVLENEVCKLLGLPQRHDLTKKPANDNKPSLDSKPSTEPEKPLPLIDPRDWQDKPLKPRKWFVDKLIPAGVPTLFSGDGGTGKSQLALQLIAASSLRVDWLGLKVSEGPCLYYGAEDTADELHRRFASIVAHYGRKLEDLKDVRLVSMAEYDAVLAMPDRGGQLQATKVMEKLCAIAGELKPKLIAIDTSADAFGGDEIKRVQVRQFITMLRQMAKVAIMSRLGEFGIGPSVAEPIAAEFTDRGADGRAPGEFYSSGKTWIVATDKKIRIVNTTPGASIGELLDETETGTLTQSAVVIDLTRFIESLDSKLKIADYKAPTYRMPGVPGEIEFK